MQMSNNDKKGKIILITYGVISAIIYYLLFMVVPNLFVGGYNTKSYIIYFCIICPIITFIISIFPSFNKKMMITNIVIMTVIFCISTDKFFSPVMIVSLLGYVCGALLPVFLIKDIAKYSIYMSNSNHEFKKPTVESIKQASKKK